MSKRIERIERYAGDEAHAFLCLLKEWCAGKFAANSEIHLAVGDDAYRVFDVMLGKRKRETLARRTQALNALFVPMDKTGSLLANITEEQSKELKRKLAKLMSEG